MLNVILTNKEIGDCIFDTPVKIQCTYERLKDVLDFAERWGMTLRIGFTE